MSKSRVTFSPAKATAALRAMGRQAILELAYTAEDRIAARCPVDTGHMKSTIAVVDHGDPNSVFVVCTAHYSPYVEFGHWDGIGNRGLVPPNPFFRNGLLDAAAEFPSVGATMSLNSHFDRETGVASHVPL